MVTRFVRGVVDQLAAVIDVANLGRTRLVRAEHFVRRILVEVLAVPVIVLVGPDDENNAPALCRTFGPRGEPL